MPNENVDVKMLLPILRRVPLFSTLEEELHKEIIVEHIVLMYYPPKYALFNEGDEGDALYIVKNGEVEIFHPPEEEGDFSKKVATIGEGSFFGEMALVSDAPRNASAVTAKESEIFLLSREDFDNLVNNNANLAEQISTAVVSRLKQNNQNKK